MTTHRLHALLLSLIFAVAAFGSLTPGPSIAGAPDRAGRPGDFNGDGLTDFVHPRKGGSYFLINQGGGNFTRHDFELPDSADVVGTMDANGDGRADLITADRAMHFPGEPAPADRYRLFLMGEQLAYGPPMELGFSLNPYVADVDADGKDDLVLSKASTLQVLISRGDGTFAAREPFNVPAPPVPNVWLRLYAGDVNHDGIRDIVTRVTDGLAILIGTGSGDFSVSSRYLPSHFFNGQEAHLGDINGDGHLDVAVASSTRVIRVFLGDGNGGFPRFATEMVRRVHDVVAPPHVQDGLKPDSSPPKLALGHFLRSGRTEILASTVEADLVVLAWENKKLREVARFETEFLVPGVYPGQYFEPGKTDLYVDGNISNGVLWPKARFFSTDLLAPPTAAMIAGGRSRAVRGFAAPPATRFDVQMQGDACITTPTTEWTLVRDGIFGFTPDYWTVETAEDDDRLAVRFTAPWAAQRVVGYLDRHGNRYVGEAFAMTACGASKIQMVVTPR